MPPRSWTAWPLSSDIVPRTGEQIGREDGVGAWTLKKKELQRQSRELEETLMAIMLRIAKERFEGREWESSHEHEEGKTKDKEIDIDPGSSFETSIVHEKLTEEISQDAQPGAPDDELQETYRSQELSALTNQHGIAGDSLGDAGEASENNTVPRRDPEPPSGDMPNFERPIVSADEEKSRRILRSAIRHTLTRLDELLMALHNARQACFYYGSEHTESQTDLESGNGPLTDGDSSDSSQVPPASVPTKQSSAQTSKRLGPGQPRKVVNIPAISSLDTLKSENRSTRGRKRKFYVPLEGESQEEMHTRIARLQKKTLPFTSTQAGYKSPSPVKLARGDSRKRGTSLHARKRRSTRLGLRDWSELVGAAALIGFPPKAIARTTHRCTNLFNEGIKMLSLVENPTSSDGDHIMNYMPNEIPHLGNMDNYNATRPQSDDRHRKVGRCPFRRHHRGIQRSENEMIVSESEDVKTASGVEARFFCPYTECVRGRDGFSKKSYLSTHLKIIHKLDRKGLEEAQEDSQEEMDGGVHVDGFMKELRRKAGWRGVDGKQRRRKSWKCEREGDRERSNPESLDGRDESESDLDEALDSD